MKNIGLKTLHCAFALALLLSRSVLASPKPNECARNFEQVEIHAKAPQLSFEFMPANNPRNNPQVTRAIEEHYAETPQTVRNAVDAVNRMTANWAAIPARLKVQVFPYSSKHVHCASTEFNRITISSGHEIAWPGTEGKIDPLITHEYAHRIWLLSAEKYLKTVWKNRRMGILIPRDPIKIFIKSPLATSFNEVFADTLAVIQAKDGSAITKYLLSKSNFVENKMVYFNYVARDFNSGLTLNDLKKDPNSRRFLDPHNALAIARSFIGKTYLKRAMRDESYAQKLTQAVFEVSSDLIFQFHSKGEVYREDSLPLVTLNELFIDKIKKRMR